MEQAKKAGAVIVKEAQDTFWGGYAGYFEDPTGICGRSYGIRILKLKNEDNHAYLDPGADMKIDLGEKWPKSLLGVL